MLKFAYFNNRNYREFGISINVYLGVITYNSLIDLLNRRFGSLIAIKFS